MLPGADAMHAAAQGKSMAAGRSDGGCILCRLTNEGESKTRRGRERGRKREERRETQRKCNQIGAARAGHTK